MLAGWNNLKTLLTDKTDLEQNGVVTNGTLVWIDIERKCIAPEIWKSVAIDRFDAIEINEAKNALLQVVDPDSIKNKDILKNRKGTDKEKREVDDILGILNDLDESNKMPVFIATSQMIMRTPFYNS